MATADISTGGKAPHVRSSKREGTGAPEPDRIPASPLSWVVVLATVLCCLAGGALALPRAALAMADDTEPVTLKRNHKVTGVADFHYMTDERTGRILYCIIFGLPQPGEDSSLAYGGRISDLISNSKEDDDFLPFSGTIDHENPNGDRSLKVMKRAFDYIAYHGYFGDTSLHIGDVTGDADKLYLTTQLALYLVMESEDEALGSMGNDPAAKAVVEPARVLYKEALAYAKDTKEGPEKDCALYYLTDDFGVQNVLTRKPVGRIRIEKESTEPGISTKDSGYSLEGAEFTIFSDKNLTEEVDATFTYENGLYVSSELPFGDYWVKETKAPVGFSVAAREQNVHIAGGPQTITVEEPPVFALVDKVLTKVDSETGSAQTTGAGTLAGAQFTVSFYADATGALNEQNLPSKPTRSWTIETDEQGVASLDVAHLVSGDDLYTSMSGSVGLPLGFVVVTETKAPDGYRIGHENTWATHVDGTMAEQSLASQKPIMLVKDGIVREEPIRADIAFDKVEKGSAKAMAGVLFRVTAQHTGESHIIMTDESGHFSSRAHDHSKNTNQFDKLTLRGGLYDTKDATNEIGTWFYGQRQDGTNETSTVDDERGAFPYDTYTFQELPSGATANHDLISFDVTIGAESDSKEITLGNKEDSPISLKTVAVDGSDGDKYLTDGETIIKDTVSYEGLSAGTAYTLTCTLMDADTGTALLDASGEPYSTSVSLIPQSAKGSTDIQVPLAELPDTSRIVVYERLTRDGMLVASHEDPDDSDQTVWLPSICTTLVDATGSHSIPSDASCGLTDTVEYRGLIPEKTYELVGRLVDRSSGSELTATTAEFTTSASQGTTRISFTLDTTDLGGHDVVAFETLRCQRQTVCEHSDLDDDQQTVSVVRSFATLPETGSHTLAALISLGCVSVAVGGLGRLLRLRGCL